MGLSLAACDSIDRLTDTMHGMFDTKKRLPGDRRPVFPEGVPGVTQGVPSEYLPASKQPGEEASEPAAQQGESSAESKSGGHATREETETGTQAPTAADGASAKEGGRIGEARSASPRQTGAVAIGCAATAPTQPSPTLPWPAAPPAWNVLALSAADLVISFSPRARASRGRC